MIQVYSLNSNLILLILELETLLILATYFKLQSFSINTGLGCLYFRSHHTLNSNLILLIHFTKMWSENLRSMGIDHKRFHDLRHTVATVMLEDGEAMNTVQEQLGHYDAGFTASRYGHVTAKMRNSAAVKLGERLEKVRNPEEEDAEDANSIKNEDTVIPFQEGRKLKSAACKIK